MKDAQSADKKKPSELWIDKAHELAALKPDLLEQTLDAMEPNAAASFRDYLGRKSGDPANVTAPKSSGTPELYEYPNGLQCAASAAVVKRFERIVPPISLVLMISGMAVTASLHLDNPFLTITLIMVWMTAVILVQFFLHDKICKPLNPLFRRR